MVINALIFPGVMFFLLYAFLMPRVITLLTRTTTQFSVYAINAPPVVQSLFEYGGMDIISVAASEEESIKKDIIGKTEAFLLIFPQDFEQQITSYDVHTGNPAPEIFIFFNSLARGFPEQYGKLIAVLDAWETSMVNKFDINRTNGGDLVEDEDKAGYFLSILLPVFLIIFMFHGAMAVTIGAITGEKERGTFAAILVAPISTRELSAGKILGLGIETFLCGVSGTLGIIFSMPRFINNLNIEFASFQNQAGKVAVNFGFYSLTDYGALLLTLFSAAYLIVTVVALVSILAKTIREAQMLLTPIFIALMSLSVLSAVYGSSGFHDWYHYLIPFYNTIQILSGIFYRNYSFLQILPPILTNLFLSFIGMEMLARLFKNEKIMFNT